MRLPGAELVVRRSQVPACRLPGFEVCPCGFEQPLFERDNRIVVNRIRREVRLSIARLYQAVRNERAGTDQQLVARK